MKIKIVLFILLASTFGMSSASCPNACEEGQPNPAVDRIDYSLVNQTSATTGTVQIVGVVENKGSGNYESSQGKQIVQLYEDVELVSQQAFENLAAGATVTVSHTRTWNTNNEFPPMYRVLIVYDPDIYIDANPNNNDCQTSDNSLERDGAELNDEFPTSAL